MERVIKVTGKGNVSVKPDLIRLNLRISDMKATYEDTVKLSTAMTELLRVSFMRLDFKKDDLKTVSFKIDTEYQDEINSDGTKKRVLQGYRFEHQMKLEFPLDNTILSNCLTELAKCVANPEFSITYTVKDPDSVKDMLLGKAVGCARGKAETLAQAAGVTLGALQTIEYSWGEMALESSTTPVFSIPSDETKLSKLRLNITPNEIQVGDSVTVIWGIK